MSWYCITLGPEQREFGFADIFRAEMEEFFISRGAPAHFSVWLQENEDDTRIFLSPVAAQSAQVLLFRFGATPCPEPDKHNLTFMLGHAYRDDSG